MDLKDRKKQILKIIIDNYINYGIPIGSKSVMENMNQKLSPATIRNEMAALEEMGFLIQPHTSAGRVPSDLAYRFYVDWLMDTMSLSREENRAIKSIFNTHCNNVKQVIDDASKVLSDITNCVAIATLPTTSNVVIKQIKLIKVTNNRAIVVIVTNVGIVNDRVISVNEEFTQQDLDEISIKLSEYVQMVENVEDIKDVDFTIPLEQAQIIINELMNVLSDDVYNKEKQIIINGALNIFDFPEYNDTKKAKMLMQSFEQKNILLDVLVKSKEGIDIKIGNESEIDAIKDCSLVTVNYNFGNKGKGGFGIIGPKRMNYSKIFAILEAMAINIEKMIDESHN